MDLRERKTKRSLKKAFLELRATKPLEKITIKELAQSAEISKATFYLHYKDIYDLSNQLQDEMIQDILNSIIQPGIPLLDMNQISRLLFESFCIHQDLVDILFSGSQESVLVSHLERGIKEYIFSSNPALRNDMVFNILLSYRIYGAYYAYWENYKQFGSTRIVEMLDNLSIEIH